MEIYDIAIIGGGILGTMTARELSRYSLNILLLEKASDMGEGPTKANSGILYAGFHPRGGSLKGISCVKGNALFPSLCQELSIPMMKTGSLMACFHQDGLSVLEEKYQKGMKNGVPDLRIISGDEARAMEPLLSERAIKALYAPTTGIISPFQLIVAVAGSAVKNGVELLFDSEVEHIEQKRDGRGLYYTLSTAKGDFSARYIVNTAGGNADKLDALFHPRDLLIKPRRGEYYILDKQRPGGLQMVLYQVQEEDEGGTLVAPTIEGNIIIGPTSEDVKSYSSVETSQKGLDHIEKVARKLIPSLDMGQVIANFAGVRANIKNLPKEQKDFILRRSAPQMVSALGVKNPGMTASPYLAKELCRLLTEAGLVLMERKDFDPYLAADKLFLTCSRQEQERLLAQDSTYGHLICRCEKITEGDIRRVLAQSLPPHNLNGLKKRLRLGMGVCQGSFCTPRIIEILSRELNIPPEKVLKGEKGSNLVKGKVK